MRWGSGREGGAGAGPVVWVGHQGPSLRVSIPQGWRVGEKTTGRTGKCEERGAVQGSFPLWAPVLKGLNKTPSLPPSPWLVGKTIGKRGDDRENDAGTADSFYAKQLDHHSKNF